MSEPKWFFPHSVMPVAVWAFNVAKLTRYSASAVGDGAINLDCRAAGGIVERGAGDRDAIQRQCLFGLDGHMAAVQRRMAVDLAGAGDVDRAGGAGADIVDGAAGDLGVV